MNGRQRRENERNIRSNDFLNENSADFAANQIAAAKITELGAKVVKTEEEFQKQLAGNGQIKQNYVTVDNVYGILLDEMRGVRDIVRSMAQSDPGLEDKFRLPSGTVKRKTIAAARVFADEAEKMQQKFLDYGMDANFIADLRNYAETLEEALAEAESSTGNRVGATDTLEIEVREANKIVEFLDPIVRRIYRDNPTKLAAWIYASHVDRHTPKPRLKEKS